ncbi:MAG: trypsin-like peptidase domain-containing protein [Ruminococcus sp.]|nr:trypsin-like peptidase domain-containing protein [Candidatus Copronaster equi]
MKKIKSLLAIILSLVFIISLTVPAFAKTETKDLQKSIVFIYHKVKFTAKNYNFSATQGFTGTGFAVGTPGKPVQYIASANHVTDPGSGIYKVVIDENGEILDFSEFSGKYPQAGKDQNGNTVVVDYFTGVTIALDAYYSVSTDDKVSLSVIQKNYEHDVALCKIGSEPTTKIEAKPLRSYKDVDVGEDITVIGYPGTTEYFNTEAKYDFSDSTVTKGTISKIQLTSGIRNSDTQFYTYLVDAQIARGSSGGPLFDKDGNILGVCSFFYTDSSQSAQSNYFIVIDEIISLLNAAGVPYKEAGDISVLLIALIIVAVVLIAAFVILLAMRNKKKQQPNVPMPQFNEPAGLNNQNVPADNTVGATMPERSNGKVYLLGVNGYFAGKKFSIENRAVIGRDASRCNVVFPADQPGVSSIHCEVVRNGDSLLIKDCNSTYGTYFSDGNKITPNLPIVLKNGAQFWVGDKDNAFEVKY